MAFPRKSVGGAKEFEDEIEWKEKGLGDLGKNRNRLKSEGRADDLRLEFVYFVRGKTDNFEKRKLI